MKDRTGDLKGVIQQFDSPVHVLRRPEMYAYPTTFWKNVMALCLSGSHQFVTNLSRERNVDQMVAVCMTDLPPGQTILRPSEAMWARDDAGQRTHCRGDFFRSSWNGQRDLAAGCLRRPFVGWP